MAHICIIGGTGFAGTNITREAASRGHSVRVLTRRAPADPVDGVEYLQGDATDPAAVEAAVQGADVVVSALSPRGPLAGRTVEAVRGIARAALEAGARLGSVGGAGSLQVSPDGPRLFTTDGFPDFLVPESSEMFAVTEMLQQTDPALDWFVLCPAAEFNVENVGERTGTYRVGGHELLADEEGRSRLSGPDLGVAFIDEIESPAHHRDYFTVAY